MPTRSRTTLALVAGALLAGALQPLGHTLGAQQRRVVPPADAKRFVVLTLRGPKPLGYEVGNAIRERMERDIPLKEVWTLTKNDIEGFLENSGYPKDEALGRGDAKMLATQVRADEYLEGQVTRTEKGVRVEAVMVLGRDNKLTQPLPVAEGSNSQVATQIVKSVREARKQLEGERKCRLAVTDRPPKPAEAIAAAEEGIAAYPQATIARYCKAQALALDAANAEKTLAVLNEILAIDPRHHATLLLAKQTYEAQKDTGARYVDVLGKLFVVDPSVDNRVGIGRDFGRIGRAKDAVPVIAKALEESPGDPDLLRLQWLLLLNVEEWKQAVAAGEELIKADTAAADTSFFERLSRAYLADSQKTKAIEAAERGMAKFASSRTLPPLRAAMLVQVGDTARAIAAYEDMKAKGFPGTVVNPPRLRLYASQPEKLRALLAEMRADPANAEMVAGVALQQGNAVRKKCDETKAPEPCTLAIQWLAFSDSVKASPDAKFLIGATAFTYGMQKLQDANRSRSCDEAKVSQDMLLVAQINVPAGGAKYPDNAKQLMQYLAQYAPSAEQMVKSFCKPGASGGPASR